ncbi:MAG: hypothetical protein AAGN15_02560 [Cyanobacteria bacterium J06581_3]
MAKFFEIEPLAGEMIALDSKVLRESYLLETPTSNTESHRAIQLVTVYVVERGLILPLGAFQQSRCSANIAKYVFRQRYQIWCEGRQQVKL